MEPYIKDVASKGRGQNGPKLLTFTKVKLPTLGTEGSKLGKILPTSFHECEDESLIFAD